MTQHIDRLVILVITGAILILLLTLGFYVKATADESSEAQCAASVLARAQGVALSDTIEVPLKGCDTRYEVFAADDSDAKVAARMAKDYAWCHRSFVPVMDSVSLVRQQETFCHVCAYYQRAGNEPLKGLPDAIEKRGVPIGEGEDAYKINSLPGQSAEDALRSELTFNDQIAIITYQARTDEHPWLQKMYRKWMGAAAGGGAAYFAAKKTLGLLPYTGPAVKTATAAGVVGGYFFGEKALGDVDVEGGIVIRPLNETAVNELGCTVTDPSQASW